MKASEVIKFLQNVAETHGDIEVELQIGPEEAKEVVQRNTVTSYPDFFAVPEKYLDGWRVNLRTWPY